ncbi:hypothetical protein BKA59DRAFT_492592 [Fusarium tricinctum]|uniref:Tyrosinase copper-binding domain-containing protein n=1 Tax=Fusarium tricinctum TaxID=61284 RepID=A0A8K0S5N6_9HYPO|nr:hypothetical protein BKA59DRAFT_492592 [Fusarium tricinctum]
MRFLLFTVPALCAAATVPKTCENAPKRIEWRQLDQSARPQYVDAVLCLGTKPSRIGLNSTLYDDFPYVHSKLDKKIHFVASFLPWHRYFVHVFEGALKECDYKGVMPYWDWSLDAEDVPKSAIWDAKTGFGGDGSLNKTEPTYGGRSFRKCVNDGPFKDLYPMYFGGDYTPHCLSREWNDGSENVGKMFSDNYTKEAVNKIQEVKSYDEYRQQLEAGPHGAIHSAMGGDMIPNTSPNGTITPEKNPKTRHTDFSGIKTEDQFDGTKPPPASLDDILLMLGLAGDLKVKDMMNTESSLLCYSY